MNQNGGHLISPSQRYKPNQIIFLSDFWNLNRQLNRKACPMPKIHELLLKSDVFYANYRVVASMNPGWFQSALDLLRGVSDWVGLRTNVRKTVGMV